MADTDDESVQALAARWAGNYHGPLTPDALIRAFQAGYRTGRGDLAARVTREPRVDPEQAMRAMRAVLGPRTRRVYPRCACGHSVRSHNDLGYCQVGQCDCSG